MGVAAAASGACPHGATGTAKPQRGEAKMPDNRGVAYMGRGTVEVQNIDYPTFELKDGPGVNPANVGRQLPHAAILKCVGRTSAARTSTWCAVGRPRLRG